jgi:cytidylate kinase
MATSHLNSVPVIAVDGPSGSGKGTVARMLARRLGWHLLDSGALYRIVGVAAAQRGVALDDAAGLGALVGQLQIVFRDDPGADALIIEVDGVGVGDAIRSEVAGEAASRVAQLESVRSGLLALQRSMRTPPGLIADGRDMGTVVFTDAALKIFLTASAEERANRRYKQLMDKGFPASLPALVSSLKERDARDSERALSPLRPAADAVIIDSTSLSPDAVLARVIEALQGHGIDEPRA